MQQKLERALIKSLAIPLKFIQRRIYLIRGVEVMLSSDLAELYEVTPKVLNQAVKRNQERFPGDFMFKLDSLESTGLRSQFVTLEKGRGRYFKYPPLAFTEHGVAMLSSVLNSKHAIQMNIFIIRAFIQLRKMLTINKDLAKRLIKIEGKQKLQGQVLAGVVDEIKKFKNPPKTNAIGFNWRTN